MRSRVQHAEGEDGAMSEWKSAHGCTVQALCQEPLWEMLGVQPGQEFRADLHTHTTISDGSNPFAQLMGEARVRGLSHLAVTNHDTTIGLGLVAQQAAVQAFSVVCGVEISAWDPATRRRVHILGLGLGEESPAVRDLCQVTLARRSANTAWQMRQLLDAGFAVDVEYAAELAARSTGFYKQHLMAALTDAEFSSAEYQLLYKTLFKNGGIAQRDIRYVDMRDAVDAVVADGGVAVLAHPGQFDNYESVPALVDAGLSGIEKFHPDHDCRDTQLCEELAARYGLFCTGGSDYHGRFGKVPYPGYRFIAGCAS